ncbi:MAG: carboxymuconolactone decarboxylase family protein [Hyphomicrobiaceae bacterium]
MMARIPYPERASLSDDAREMLERLPAKVGVFEMIAHADTCLKPVMKLGGAILGKTTLNPLLREFCLLHAVKLEGGMYEYTQHVPVALQLGGTQAQIDALESGDDTAACFNEREKSCLKLTREVVVNVQAGEATVEAARAHISEREIVELILMIGYYIMLARITETLGVEEDPPVGNAVLDNVKEWVAKKGG